MVRFNKLQDREQQTFRISLLAGGKPTWFLHPKADVAVIRTSWKDLDAKGARWETFVAERGTLTRIAASDFGLLEGDEVFMIGFPIGWREAQQDYPIVRHGTLAQIQGWLRKEHDTFLIDSAGFPGNSGGPVITKPQLKTVDGVQSSSGFLLIGMVSNLKTWKEEGTGEILDLVDLVEIIPMDLIDETIELAKEQEKGK